MGWTRLGWKLYEPARVLPYNILSAHDRLGKKGAVSDKYNTNSTAYYCFPTPEAVAGNNLAFLRMPQARKEAVRQFACLFLNDKVPNHKEILAIKGVGPWTLDYLKMRGERNPDVYLEGDLIVRKMAQRYPVEPAQAAPWRSYLTLQLWQLSNQQKEV